MSIKFSVVTTCRNEMQSFPQWKQDILGQTRQPDEIVIVDAFSDDGTAEMLLDWASGDERIVVIQEKGNAAHGRNLAVERAKNEHILSTDMGVRLCPVWCEELITPFESDPTVDVVAGSVLMDSDTVKTVVARAEYYVDHDAHMRSGDRCVIGNNSCAYTKRVWRELGGLPEDLTFYADDSVFGRQIVATGYKVVNAPEALVFWGRPEKLQDFCKEAYRYGRGDGEANIKTPFAFKLYSKRFVPKSLVPFLTGIRGMQKQLQLKSIKRALKAADFLALFMIPVLLFCRSYSFGKGYLIGDEYGQKHCQACRARLCEPGEKAKPMNAGA